MYYYKTKIQYIGTQYAGLQWQQGLNTIQGQFNMALAKIIKGKFTTMSASRTDSGVHAIEQIIKISSEELIDCQHFIMPFNQQLPKDISCLEINTCQGLFKPANDALSKEYRYYFTNKKRSLKSEQQYIANIAPPLDFEKISICISAIIGTHDFCNFYSTGSNVTETIRNILSCEINQVNPQEIFINEKLFQIPQQIESCYEIKIIADGFLKQMIRHLISALWMVGSGKISTNEFINLIDAKKVDKQLRKVAPANGLFLYRINYPF